MEDTMIPLKPSCRSARAWRSFQQEWCPSPVSLGKACKTIFARVASLRSRLPSLPASASRYLPKPTLCRATIYHQSFASIDTYSATERSRAVLGLSKLLGSARCTVLLLTYFSSFITTLLPQSCPSKTGAMDEGRELEVLPSHWPVPIYFASEAIRLCQEQPVQG
ncbi:hypothetical protein VTI74DRAFT_4161 [Chaetomium olivicolor]